MLSFLIKVSLNTFLTSFFRDIKSAVIIVLMVEVVDGASFEK